MPTERYLNLQDHRGVPLPRPILKFLAATCETSPDDIDHLYETMLASDVKKGSGREDGVTSMGKAALALLKRDAQNRTLAAYVVLELYRYKLVTGTVSPLRRAREMVAHQYAEHADKPRSEHLVSTVKKADLTYRDILHFIAAHWFYESLAPAKRLTEDNECLRQVMGLATHFEATLDEVFLSNQVHWHPIRVPPGFDQIKQLNLPKEIRDIPLELPEKFWG